MGREIRKVPADWQHPTTDEGDFKPVFDRDYIDSLNQWWANHQLWQDGNHPDQLSGSATKDDARFFAQWDGDPPSVEYYRFYRDEDCTHFQMYETVTEGTPTTPVFATLQELEDYLVDVGEMAGTRWQRKYSREGAKAFCMGGYAPSMMIIPGHGVVTGVEAMGMTHKDKTQ